MLKSSILKVRWLIQERTNVRIQGLKVFCGLLKNASINTQTHGVNANVINVMSLVKNNDRLLWQFFGHNLSYFRIQQVVVTVDNHISVLHRIAS